MQRLTLVFTLALIFLLVVACNTPAATPTSSPPPGQGNQPPKVKPTVVEQQTCPGKTDCCQTDLVEPTVPPKATTSTGGSIPTPGPTTAVSFLKECVMAKSVNPTTFAPIDVTTKFDMIQEKYYVVCRVEQMSAGQVLRGTWSAWPTKLGVKLKLGESTLTLSQSGSGYFDFNTDAPSTEIREGPYRVEVYVNDKLARTIDFSVAK